MQAMLSFSHIQIVSDGVPGHVNQARGLASWLCDYAGMDASRQVSETVVTIKIKPLRPLYRFLLNRRSSMARDLIARTHQHWPANLNSDCLVISCGGNTSFANAALGLQGVGSNVFIGSLRGLDSDCFTAVMTIEPVLGARNNVVMDFSPSYINLREIEWAASQYREQQPSMTPLWCLLIGGDGAGYQFDEQDWRQLAEGLNVLAQRYGIRWLVSTSRRSGVQVEEIMRLTCTESLFDTIWFTAQGNQSLQGFLGAAERIFCTEDSMTMLAESINAGKPVTSLRPMQSQPNQRFLDAIQRFERNRYLQRVMIGDLAEFEPPAMVDMPSPEAAKLKTVEQLLTLIARQRI